MLFPDGHFHSINSSIILTCPWKGTLYMLYDIYCDQELPYKKVWKKLNHLKLLAVATMCTQNSLTWWPGGTGQPVFMHKQW